MIFVEVGLDAQGKVAPLINLRISGLFPAQSFTSHVIGAPPLSYFRKKSSVSLGRSRSNEVTS
jgi:hypothetical protein